MSTTKPKGVDRRSFLQGAATAGVGLALAPRVSAEPAVDSTATIPDVADPDALASNIAHAISRPRTEDSMPGRYRGVVADVTMPGVWTADGADATGVAAMLAAVMKSLTGAGSSQSAWLAFVKPEDTVAIKVNPVGGSVCGTTHTLTQAVISAIESAGVKRKNILFIEHYESALTRWGYDRERYPGIDAVFLQRTVTSGNREVSKGYDDLDKEAFYECDFVIPDEDNYLEQMLNGGTRSYFPKVLTRRIDKIISIPALKHHRTSYVTLGLKNLAFGLTSNCMRGHKFIDRYTADVCAFPPIRDKAVLTILDGLRGQYDNGPRPSPQHVWAADTIMVASDTVALDTVGFNLIAAKRVEMGVETKAEAVAAAIQHDFLVRAENLGLGVHLGGPIFRRSPSVT